MTPAADLPKAEHTQSEDDFQAKDWNHHRPDRIEAHEIGDVTLVVFDPGSEEAPCCECDANQDAARHRLLRAIPASVSPCFERRG